LINGRDGVGAELDLGVGWQDPAVIRETGLCVWRSGPRPILDFKRNGDELEGRMAIMWTGKPHDTPGLADMDRDYARIAESASIAREGVLAGDLHRLAEGVGEYYAGQLAEGMEPLPELRGAIARKYCGGGHGGYALYLFVDPVDRSRAMADNAELRAIEPVCRT
jgi:hypothetical protein